jgi:hypothetical protein
MRILTAVLGGLLLLVSAQVGAIEFKPYPGFAISKEQWSVYYEQVVDAAKETRQNMTAQKLEGYFDRDRGIAVIFTRPGHAAHPAWVARRPVLDGKQLQLEMVGYFAGDQAAFKKLFAEHQQQANQLADCINQADAKKLDSGAHVKFVETCVAG